MIHSYSSIGCFANCPRRYKYQYLDKLKTIDEQNADNALYLGSAIHKGIECGLESGLDEYKSHFNIIEDAHINWLMQLEYQIPKVIELLPTGGIHELELKDEEFHGFVDYICGDTLYDFKFSNNISNYVESPQLSIYKYYLEKLRPDIKINHLVYVFIPKINIRQRFKSQETIQQFRNRLTQELENSKIQLVEVPYVPTMVTQFQQCCQMLDSVSDYPYPKQESKLCDWCAYKEYCQSDETTDYMIYRKREEDMFKKIWIYGEPFSGKTTFAVKAPKHLVLSTDGNAQYATDSFKVITDEVRKNGRIVLKKFAWEVFKDQIVELQTNKQYETIIVDLVEDTYEMCRLYMYNKLGISHESDDSYRAWDKVRTEYLSTMRTLMNLPYDIILISHEDKSKDITKKNGENITAIKPNLSEKVRDKLAGMVAVVGRVVSDNNKYRMEIKPDEMTFGGGRLNLNNITLPLEWEDVSILFDRTNR